MTHKTRLLGAVALLFAQGAAAFDPTTSAGLAVGRFEPNPNPQMSGQSGGGGFDFEVVFRPRRHWALGFDIGSYSQQYATPSFVDRETFWGDVSGEMNIQTAFITLQAVYALPIGRTMLQAEAGGGWYRSNLTIDGPMFGTYADETDSDFGTNRLVRWDVMLAPGWYLGAQYRRVAASADFGQWSGGPMDVGGTQRLVTLRFQFASSSRS